MDPALRFADLGVGPPVLFVHGGGTHGPLWAADLAAACLRGAQVVRRVGGDERAIPGWLRYVLSYRTGDSAWSRLSESRREAMRANAGGVFADLSSGDGSAQVDDQRPGQLSLPVMVVFCRPEPRDAPPLW